MSNSNERQTNEREVRQEFYNKANGDTYTNVQRTTETVNNNTTQQTANSYRNGYMQGRVSERRHQEDLLVQRDNDNAGRGLLVGILLTSLIGLTVGAVWLVNQTNKEATQVTPPVIIPNSQPDRDSSPKARPAPQKETIIERTRDVLVPVPQPQAPSPAPQQQAPSPAPQQNINITPNSASQPPATEKTPTQSQDTQTNTEATAASQTQEKPSQPENSTSDSSPTTNTDNTSPAAQ